MSRYEPLTLYQPHSYVDDVDETSGTSRYGLPNNRGCVGGVGAELYGSARPFVRRCRGYVPPIQREPDLDQPENQDHQERDRKHDLHNSGSALRPNQQPTLPQTLDSAVDTIATSRSRAIPQIATTRALVIRPGQILELPDPR